MYAQGWEEKVQKKPINLKLLNVLAEFRRVARDPRWIAGRSLNTSEDNSRRVQFGMEVNCKLREMLSVSEQLQTWRRCATLILRDRVCTDWYLKRSSKR